jgi:hypothetical protein
MATATSPRVEIRRGGEVYRVDPAEKRPAKRTRFLGWVDYMETPKPPIWPTAGWWAGAGISCHVTGLGTLDEAVVALLDAHGIDLSEFHRG